MFAALSDSSYFASAFKRAKYAVVAADTFLDSGVYNTQVALHVEQVANLFAALFDNSYFASAFKRAKYAVSAADTFLDSGVYNTQVGNLRYM